MPQKSVGKAIALLCGKNVTQNTQVGKIQLRNIHIQINLILHVLNIDMAATNISRQVAVERQFRSIWIHRIRSFFRFYIFAILVFLRFASEKQHRSSHHYA